jgi:hypothetical protein
MLLFHIALTTTILDVLCKSNQIEFSVISRAPRITLVVGGDIGKLALRPRAVVRICETELLPDVGKETMPRVS